jgi:hypothetical protein
VSIEAASPEAAVRLFQQHLNRVLNTVLTDYRLEFLKASGELYYLSFFTKRDEPVAVKLRKRPWHLFLSQTLAMNKLKSGRFELKTAGYAYRIQASSAIDEEPFVRFEYVGTQSDPNFPYCRNHVQFHKDYDGTVPPFLPCKFHVPTGWVTMESVIRFAVTDLRVPPAKSNWRQILSESEEQFKQWTSRTV